MSTMKRFGTYFVIIILLFVITMVIEKLSLSSNYSNISCTFDSSYDGKNGSFQITNLEAKSSVYDGYISFDITNTSMKLIEKCFVKIDLYNDLEQLAKTDYEEVDDFQPGETRKISLKYKANNIKRFAVSVVELTPDKTNILDLFGWEIDLTNVFGHDLTKITVGGIPLLERLGIQGNGSNASGILGKIGSFFGRVWENVRQVPWWAYAIGWCMIVGLL